MQGGRHTHTHTRAHTQKQVLQRSQASPTLTEAYSKRTTPFVCKLHQFQSHHTVLTPLPIPITPHSAHSPTNSNHITVLTPPPIPITHHSAHSPSQLTLQLDSVHLPLLQHARRTDHSIPHTRFVASEREVPDQKGAPGTSRNSPG